MNSWNECYFYPSKVFWIKSKRRFWEYCWIIGQSWTSFSENQQMITFSSRIMSVLWYFSNNKIFFSFSLVQRLVPCEKRNLFGIGWKHAKYFHTPSLTPDQWEFWIYLLYQSPDILLFLGSLRFFSAQLRSEYRNSRVNSFLCTWQNWIF